MDNRGFTLLELAVVLVVVALVTASVVAGKTLLQAAEMRSVVSELNVYANAIKLFKNYYNAYPGDLETATEYWSGARANGNGNNFVEHAWDQGGNGISCNSTAREDFLSWQHLNLAGFLPGRYTANQSVVKDCYNFGENAPATTIIGPESIGGFSFRTESPYGRTGTQLVLAAAGNQTKSPSGHASLLTTIEAQSIDEKIDDGIAASGETMTTKGEEKYNGQGDGCLDETTTPHSYDLTNAKKRACIMRFFVD